jgi:hypothetical protein
VRDDFAITRPLEWCIVRLYSISSSSIASRVLSDIESRGRRTIELMAWQAHPLNLDSCCPVNGLTT